MQMARRQISTGKSPFSVLSGPQAKQFWQTPLILTSEKKDAAIGSKPQMDRPKKSTAGGHSDRPP